MAYSKIGLKIRKIRGALGLSQMKLAERVGVSFQQIQKYESGANKVSLEKLEKIAEALKVPATYFFGEKESKKGRKGPVVPKDREECGEIGFDDLSGEELQLILRFSAIKSVEIKKGVMLIVNGAN